jgi:putative FmdB family regulatory protein
MPTYHYRCSDCGHAFDRFQKFSEDPLTECPQCEGPIRRVPQPVGIVFKGSGWYINDSRASKDKSNNGTGKSDSSSDKPAEKASSEPAKPAAAAAAD